MQFHPLFTDEYLFSHWAGEYERYKHELDSTVHELLKQWNDRDQTRSETQLEGAFVQKFFQELWGYAGTGSQESETEYTLISQFPVKQAGQTGGTGKADLALGKFAHGENINVPQVLCEFKDIKSTLDAPQNRKGNNRSPVEQCIDYLKYAFDKTDVNSTIFPTWGIATDMNEFRLYYRKVGLNQYLGFTLSTKKSSETVVPLIGETENSKRKRFLFWKTFQRDVLLADFGNSPLEKIFDEQVIQEKSLEKSFYLEFKAYRQYTYETIVDSNPDFDGTQKELVRLTQRFLDRMIFLLFCEDMGKTLGFPVNLVRDILLDASKSEFYSSTGNDIWEKIKELFNAMRDGGVFPPNHSINKFNGGLFEKNNRLEQLKVPNRIFCAAKQGESPDAIAETKNSLLYLCATYNFGAEGADSKNTITLYALGRIFEQSITELEYMEAEAEAAQRAADAGQSGEAIEEAIENAQSIASLSKRKRTGVYYTPEWVTAYIVREVIGKRLEDEKETLGLEIGAPFTVKQIATYGKNFNRNSKVGKHVEKINEYHEFLSNIKIIDPSCGSGAFLIQALQYLLLQHEIVAQERKRVTLSESVLDTDGVIRSILTNNLYGVDLSPESVEITQLSLWLNTARKDKPLSSLDHHIREGNSLVGPDFIQFYKNKHNSLFENLDPDTQEKTNPFNWKAAFPEVLGDSVPENERGFDCVIGNPPYVKLQNYRKVKPDESEYLLHHSNDAGVKVYQSTQTGNSDLYLPFIEKGLSLINSNGRMGYIAPNVWLKNDYGIALRRMLKKTRQLERWIDFKSHQVFDEATIYTAIQFYTAKKQDQLDFYLTPDGEISGADWIDSESIPYLDLPEESSWVLLPVEETKLLNRLCHFCKNLNDYTKDISQGLISGAYWIYANELTENGALRHIEKLNKDKITYINLEQDALMNLVTTEHIRRFQTPKTKLKIIFPYNKKGELLTLLDIQKWENTFSYLKRYEKFLRNRDSGKLDDEFWYRYSRNQNLDKQNQPKILIAGTSKKLTACVDSQGLFAANDKRVYSLFPQKSSNLWFLCGIINSKVSNFVFQRIARPKANDYFDVESQYLAPLPIPDANESEKDKIGKLASLLQEKHTARRDEIEKLQVRLDSPNCLDVEHNEDWLWADVKSKAELKLEAPESITRARERTAWAKEERSRRLLLHLEKIDAKLRTGMKLTATSEEDSISVSCGNITFLTRYGFSPEEAKFIAAIWRQILRNENVTPKFDGKKLIKKLLNYRSTEDPNFRNTILSIDAKIQSLDSEIETAELEINTLIYQLYELTEEEIQLVESN